MKKSRNAIKTIVVMLLCLSIILTTQQLVNADAIANTRSGISPDKEWKVNFSNNVNYDYVNSNYIYVVDNYGNAVDVNLSVNPLNKRQVIVRPKNEKYTLGKTYILTIGKDFCNENGKKMGQDYKMQFSIKKQLVDTADFKVQVNRDAFGGVAVVTINSTSLTNANTYRVEGQEGDNTSLNDEAVIFGNVQNVTVHFYDDSGKEIGNCLINIQKASNSQVVQISN
ncbi:Ig-like domain-containing protein [Clostridium guangxiense]|uniref:Ig-like domain-containing protein n=1 Tax=Clostridium guangxiense TaxID=1662055 RepID=UPI001E321E75|nr:Ig-like domain-containing protein [Clostridium guangxiense]MCD2346278.1 Ig-like domain-containing protein [Clostridium guangxiense]